MTIISVSGEMGSLRDELAEDICQRGSLECVDRRTLMESVQGLVEMSRDEHQLLAEQGPAMLDMGIRRRRVFAAFLESVVLQYAHREKVVLVGRGANFLLRLVPGVLRVRTVAPLELRAQRLASREQISLDRARQLATVVDQQRRAYVAHVFGADWTSPLNYDLSLNMGRVSLEAASATVLDLAAQPEYETSAETRRVLADMVTAGRVRRSLVDEVDIHALEVECLEGMVVLTGYVASQADHQKAKQLATSTEDVKKVDNRLEVSATLLKFLP